MTQWIVIVEVGSAEVVPRRYEIRHSPITIGAMPECDVVLDSSFVSGY